jgi:hypothetical protein
MKLAEIRRGDVRVKDSCMRWWIYGSRRVGKDMVEGEELDLLGWRPGNG